MSLQAFSICELKFFIKNRFSPFSASFWLISNQVFVTFNDCLYYTHMWREIVYEFTLRIINKNNVTTTKEKVFEKFHS